VWVQIPDTGIMYVSSESFSVGKWDDQRHNK